MVIGLPSLPLNVSEALGFKPQNCPQMRAVNSTQNREIVPFGEVFVGSPKADRSRCELTSSRQKNLVKLEVAEELRQAGIRHLME
jgi:hypothetical protein